MGHFQFLSAGQGNFQHQRNVVGDVVSPDRDAARGHDCTVHETNIISRSPADIEEEGTFVLRFAI